jgi:hypothetical protein
MPDVTTATIFELVIHAAFNLSGIKHKNGNFGFIEHVTSSKKTDGGTMNWSHRLDNGEERIC